MFASPFERAAPAGIFFCGPCGRGPGRGNGMPPSWKGGRLRTGIAPVGGAAIALCGAMDLFPAMGGNRARMHHRAGLRLCRQRAVLFRPKIKKALRLGFFSARFGTIPLQPLFTAWHSWARLKPHDKMGLRGRRCREHSEKVQSVTLRPEKSRPAKSGTWCAKRRQDDGVGGHGLNTGTITPPALGKRRRRSLETFIRNGHIESQNV